MGAAVRQATSPWDHKSIFDSDSYIMQYGPLNMQTLMYVTALSVCIFNVVAFMFNIFPLGQISK